MLLYDSRVSGSSYKVRLLLAHLDRDYERREVDVVDRSNRFEILGELKPGLRVPTLVFDDGRALAESNAIIFHLAEGTLYLPEDRFERAQVLQWQFFEQYSHEPYVAVLRFWRHVAGISPSPEELEAKRRGGEAALAALERHLGPRRFLVGERYTNADTALYERRHRALRLHACRGRGRIRARALPGRRRLAGPRPRAARVRPRRRLIVRWRHPGASSSSATGRLWRWVGSSPPARSPPRDS